ncbi:hypothetical protein DPMN_193911 [Dreissena polymorpha]|uniref:Uncharacterized protein n=1 Tax=Dreissena polymorpha TaxID=45954 RepID=A0A9D3Y2V5_DREPO|nr:hypothetical protein DPMN_193911 [Dreissena polymorpha]
MVFEVDGKPDPITQLTNMETNTIVANFTGRGTYTITINDISCIEGGMYNLSTSNTVGKDFKAISINVTGY